MNDTMEHTVPAASPMDMAHSTLPSFGAVLWIGWFSLREMSRRRRLFSLMAINLLPVLVILGIRIWLPEEGVSAQLQLSGLTHQIFIPYLIPIVAMAVGVSAIGEQVQDGTVVYLWTRPIRRRAIYLGRLMAAQGVATLLLSLSLVLCFMVMVSNGFGIIDWDFFKLYAGTFLIIFLGGATYAALFAAMGTFFRKPVLPAILFTFGWESMVSNIPARVQELTLRFHLQNLVTASEPTADDLPGILGALLTRALDREPVPQFQSVCVLLAVMVLTSILGVWLLRQKEIAK